MRKRWERRFAVLVLAGACALAQTSTGPVEAAGRAVHVERQASQQGILPVVFSFFKTLAEKALASVSPAPVPGGPKTSSPLGNPSGDNGAGIDPNGG
jgi:hypothetical protein